MDNFLGYHSEWNLGSPGGWDYQRITQILGQMNWAKIKKLSGLEIELDFEHPILNPVPGFAEMLIRAHQLHFGQQEPFIVITAEEETLEKVPENANIVRYLNSLPGVKAALTAPHNFQQTGGTITLEGKQVTVIFMDFNNNVLLEISKKHKLDALLAAIKQGIVVNPRGMEPVGAKGVFEVLTGELRDKITETTLNRTPWTRQFYQRQTTGPSGEVIPDLVEWVKNHWSQVILKPEHGYSGQGILIGLQQTRQDKDIQNILMSRDYIVQPLVPLNLWAEEYPLIDHAAKTIKLVQRQTDFRCLITDAGLIGFVGRFGGIPTNVGSGGGTQAIALLRSSISIKEAIHRINQAILGLGYQVAAEIQAEAEKKAVEMGLVYLLGPIMVTLRPRLITYQHLAQLQEYSQNLWTDTIKLEKLWRDGKLAHVIKLSEAEEQIARGQPWNGSPALIASDGLFSFGGHISND